MATNDEVLNSAATSLMNEEEALAICFANLKGSKDKDLLMTARALQYLKNLPKYGSNQKVAQAVGVSDEIVREFLTLLKLPKLIQDMFEQGQLRRLEQSRRLWQLSRTRPELLETVAKAISGLRSWDARQIIEHILRNPDITVAAAKGAVLQSRTIKEREFHVIAILPEEDYRLLVNEAKKMKVPVDELVTSVVQDWLKSRG